MDNKEKNKKKVIVDVQTAHVQNFESMINDEGRGKEIIRLQFRKMSSSISKNINAWSDWDRDNSWDRDSWDR
jgi:hypothetical protein